MALSLRKGAVTGKALALFGACEAIPGYMGSDDAIHFSLVLGLQQAQGVKGDLLEIGTWFGKSAAFIANFVGPDEALIVCDAFEKPTSDVYERRPTVEVLRENISTGAPSFDFARLQVHACLSTGLKLAPTTRLRFAHVDGGHGLEEALHDLRLVADFMIAGGVVVVDDYLHPRWPEVTDAVAKFLEEDSRFVQAASLNRWEAQGQKCYLVRKVDKRWWRGFRFLKA